MNAIDAKVGQKYLSSKGTTVTVIGHKNDKVVLRVSGSDHEVPVAKDYELRPYNRSQVSKDDCHLEQSNGANAGRKPRGESVAAIIDPFLIAGSKTVKEIAELATKKAGALVKNRDNEANVRARMVTYSRKGWKIEKDDQKRVRIIKPKG